MFNTFGFDCLIVCINKEKQMYLNHIGNINDLLTFYVKACCVYIVGEGSAIYGSETKTSWLLIVCDKCTKLKKKKFKWLKKNNIIRMIYLIKNIRN